MTEGSGGAPPPRTARPSEDVAHLVAKLAAPRAHPAPRPPVAGAAATLWLRGAPQAILADLLDAVDETVMARRLTARNAEGAELALDVCNRRLLRVGAAGADLLPPSIADTLTYAGQEDLDALHAALAGFCSAEPVRLGRSPTARDATLEQTGVAVSTLRQAWRLAAPGARAAAAGMAPDPSILPDVATLCADCLDWATAGALRTGKAPARESGLAAMAAALARLTDDEAAFDTVGLGCSEGWPKALLLGQAGGSGLFLAAGIGRDAEPVRGAFFFRAADPVAIASLWQGARPERLPP